MQYSAKKHTIRKAGFTVVEVLVVIVVIAIIATLTVISYRTVQDKSNKASLESVLYTAGSKLQEYSRKNGAYPTSQASFEGVVGPVTDITFVYVASPSAEYYCLAATSSKTTIGSYVLMSGDTVKSGNCNSPTFPN